VALLSGKRFRLTGMHLQTKRSSWGYNNDLLAAQHGMHPIGAPRRAISPLTQAILIFERLALAQFAPGGGAGR
jgi:hypothetical protein